MSISEKPPPARGTGQRILVVVEDPGTVELISTPLDLAGYRITTAGTCGEALTRFAERRFDLVVLDVTLPEIVDFTGYPRLAPADRPPMLLLTPCEALSSLVPRLGLGATDYVTKPIRIAEVLARTQVLLRGQGPGQGPGERSPHYGDLVLDDATCQARRGRRLLDLTPAEYRLLRHLLVNAGQVFSKKQISQHVWGDADPMDNAIEKLVSRLRRKVDEDEPPLIHTRRGFGYWLGR